MIPLSIESADDDPKPAAICSEPPVEAPGFITTIYFSWAKGAASARGRVTRAMRERIFAAKIKFGVIDGKIKEDLQAVILE